MKPCRKRPRKEPTAMILHSDFHEKLESDDECHVIAALTAIRTQVNRSRLLAKIEPSLMALIIPKIQGNNFEVANLAVSILANVSLLEDHRTVFGELLGVDRLIAMLKKQHYLLMKDKESDDTTADSMLICRGWRLAGNLAYSESLATMLFEKRLGVLLHEYVKCVDMLSDDAYDMFCRAVRKCWKHNNHRRSIASREMYSALAGCLHSKKQKIVKGTLEQMNVFAVHFSDVNVDQDTLKKLVSLHTEMNAGEEKCLLPTKTLASLLKSCNNVQLEGTGAHQLFVQHILFSKPPEKVVVEALCELCREGAVRNLVKNSSALNSLISMQGVVKATILIPTLLSFQYDAPSVQVLASNETLVEYLMSHAHLKSSVQLMQLLARLAVPLLIVERHLGKMISIPQCRPLLDTIARCSKFFEPLVLSGKLWRLADAGAPFHEQGNTGFAEGVYLRHLCSKSTPERRRIVALSLPFLISPRNKKLIVKLFGEYHGLDEILTALNESPGEKTVIAAVVKMAEIFKNHEPAEAESAASWEINCDNDLLTESETESLDQIIFELDSGACVGAPRDLLCRQSPVVNAMLNGHFAEAGKEKVSLPGCSKAALTSLVSIVTGRSSIRLLPLDTHLELISLADRFLMVDLGQCLTDALTPLSPKHSACVYLWSLKAGYSENASKLRSCAYNSLLSDRTALRSALDCLDSRQHLIDDITGFYTECLLAVKGRT